MNSNRVDERFVDIPTRNNVSSKQLQSKMITNRKMIIYNNSRIQNIYHTILNTTYLANVKLSQTLGVEGYKYYWDTLFNSSKISQSKKNKIFDYRTLAYPIVYDIRFPSFISDIYVILEDEARLYIYGDLSYNQINGLKEYIGEVPMTVYGNNIELLNIGNVIHNTLKLTNKYGIHITLNLTFHKPITYTYPSGDVIYYQYTSTSGTYGGTSETYLSNLIVNNITSWKTYIERPMSQVFTRDGNRIDMRCSLLKDTYIEINSTNQIYPTIQGYIEDSKLYLSKSHLSTSDFKITGTNMINITNPYGITVSLQSLFYREIFQNYRVPKWIFTITGTYTYGLNTLYVNDINSWETFLNYNPTDTVTNISSWETYVDESKLYLSKTNLPINNYTNTSNKLNYYIYIAEPNIEITRDDLVTSNSITTGSNTKNFKVNILHN
jgi:hypothetical protein